MQEHTSRIAQFAMLYSISIKFLGNQNDRNKALFTPDQKEAFYDAVRAALQFIDDDIIFYNGYFSTRRIMPRPMYFNFYVQKHGGKQPKVSFADTPIGRAATTEDGVIIEPVSAMHVEMHAINNEKDTLELWGFLRNFYFMDYDKIRVSILTGTERTEGKRNEIYSLSHFFGDAVSKNYSFMVSVPKDRIKKSGSFCIECEYEGNTFRLPVCFEKPQSHLWELFPNAYWRFDKHYLKYNDKDKLFVVKKCNPLRGIKNELCYWHSMIKYGIKLERSLKCIPVRILYFLSKPFFAGKEIWITYDQLFKGGDNGEYFYRYVSERKDKGKVRIYYIVNKNTREYKQLQAKYGTVLAFNSLKNKLVSLHADYVFATRVAVNIYMGYWQQTERYFRDMFNSRVFCLQHGLTIQKIAQYQNRLFDNTRLYFCVSPAEIDNLRRPIYGYDEKELLLTGAPRYDGLVSKDKHFILISPTWRRNVTAGTNKKGSNHG